MRFFARAIGLIGLLALASVDVTAQVTFPGPELLGRPTDHSVTINVVPNAAIEAYFEYGTTSGGPYITSPASGPANPLFTAANVPLVHVVNGLDSNTRYFYRMVYRRTGTATWITNPEHSFQTQRPAGSTFNFTITSDSHLNIVFGNASLFQQTLQNISSSGPDFHLDLGDTFAMDNVTTQAQANTNHLSLRPYFGLVGHSAPVFLALGNHEQNEGWHLNDTGSPATSPAVLSANARNRYYLNPSPDNFYSGNADNTTSAINGDHLLGNYYAWQWGDALFVAIDPYWYSTTKPFIGNQGGGEPAPGSGDRWDWTLGIDQYLWLEKTLKGSTAKYKFLFAHQLPGGTADYGRGGANAVPYVEMGGYNTNGSTYAFDTRRPGWATPVHQLLVDNHVTAFFHGHDHVFAYEKRDGVVYQEVPMAADNTYGLGFQEYRETDPYTIRVLPNSGHIRVTVSPSQATVDYVRAFLPGAGTNNQVAYSYNLISSVPPVISAATSSAITESAAMVTWTTDAVSDTQVEYGTTTAYGSTTTLNPTLTTSHSASLTNLSSNTTYHFRVKSRDAAGNLATSGDNTFVTSFTISNLGGASRTTDGSGNLTAGYARIRANAGSTTPSGLAIFGYRQSGVLVSEAGVPDSPLITSGRIYAEVSADGIVNTGLAIANPNNQSAAIDFVFRNENGTILKTGTTLVGANRQTASFLNEPPFSGGRGIQGTFSFTSTMPVSVIALRGFYNERSPSEFLLTTLPVLDLSSGAGTGAQVVPHFAVGGGWTTQIILVNPTSADQSGTLQFLNAAGAPVSVSINGGSPASGAPYLVKADSSQKLVIAAAAAGLDSGTVRIVPPSTGGAAPTPLVIFTYKQGGVTLSEAGVPVTMGTAFRMYVESAPSTRISSGIAIANASAAAGTVTLSVTGLDGTAVATSAPLLLPASGQLVGFLSDFFPALASQPLGGVLRVTTTASSISVVGLRMRYNERGDFILTTTPPTIENGTPHSADRFFPHLANGGGYTTQFILFSGTAGQTSSGNLSFITPEGTTLGLNLN